MRKILGLTGLMALAAMTSLPLAAQATPDQVFAQLDANRDGKLSQAEFAAHPDLTADMFSKWDADGDKQISKEEFVANYK